MYQGQYGFWKVSGLVRHVADMQRLAESLCTNAKWTIEGNEMVITNPQSVEIRRLPIEQE